MAELKELPEDFNESEIIDITSLDLAQEYAESETASVLIKTKKGIKRYWVRQPTAEEMDSYRKTLPHSMTKGDITYQPNSVKMAPIVAKCTVTGEDGNTLLFGKNETKAKKVVNSLPAEDVTILFKKIMEISGINDGDEKREGNDNDSLPTI